MSHSKVVSRNLFPTGCLLAVAVLLSLMAISQAAPLRQQREVVYDVTVVTKTPSNSTVPDCIQVSADRMILAGTQEEVDMYADLAKAYQDGKNLSFDDLKLVYAPSCKRGSHETDRFAEIQCFTPEHSWPADLPRYFCWCADEITGYPINDITVGLITECTPPNSCQMEDEEIPHGADYSYKAEGNCQTCTCFNGAAVCHTTLSSDEEDIFTNASLTILKVQLLKRLYVEMYMVDNSASEDVISSKMEFVTAERAIEAKEYTVPWKLSQMTITWFEYLYWLSIRDYAMNDVSQFTCSFSLVSHFAAILNVNDDDGVEEEEFKDFFDLSKNDAHLKRINSYILPEE